MISYDNEHLNVLVLELSKNNPNAEVLKSKSEVLGIPYSPDMIILMSDVLVYLSKNPQKPNIMKETPA
ncbi:MAG: hypothetical protein H7256_05850 [Bdellovibrio sp.]|nr:hypothetical protein [Bdellovibrio sp.]